jgi:hypothetical protein
MCEKLLFNKYFLYCQVGVGEDGEIHQSTVSVSIKEVKAQYRAIRMLQITINASVRPVFYTPLRGTIPTNHPCLATFYGSTRFGGWPNSN